MMAKLDVKMLSGRRKADLQEELGKRGLLKSGNKKGLVHRLVNWILAKEVNEAWVSFNETPAISSGSMLSGMKKADLQEELGKRGLLKSGNKKELVHRLESWILAKEGNETPANGTAKKAASSRTKRATKSRDPKAEDPKVKRDTEAEGPMDNYAKVKDLIVKNLRPKVPCSEMCKPGKGSMCPNRKFGTMTKRKREQTMLACVEVERLLTQMGVNPKECSRCILAGIMYGFIKITGEKADLDKVIYEDQPQMCECKLKARLGDVLLQGDYGGYDFYDSKNAKIFCHDCIKKEECTGHFYFLTDVCVGKPYYEGSKHHHHCRECPDYGTCVGDYRESHCDTCGEHGWRGECSNRKCPTYQSDVDETDVCVVS